MIPHRPCPRRIGLLAAFALGPGALAQIPFQELETPDGSRVVLIPTGSRVVEWVLATPCGPLEDEAGMEGLAVAVLRDSLNGTRTIGSADAIREQRVAEELAEVKTRIADALLRRNAPAPEDTSRLAALQAEAVQLRDPAAWRRLVCGAPATEPRLRIDEDVATLALTTEARGIRGVAELLRQRREEAALYGADDRFAELVVRRTSAWNRDPIAPLRAEAAALAFGGNPVGRLAGAPPPARVASRAQIRAVWERTQHPSRSVHVLVGGFDPETVARTLREVFAQTRLPRPAAPIPTPLRPSAARIATLDGATTAAMAVVLPLPPTRAEVLEMARHWLAEDGGRSLRRRITGAGLEQFRLEFEAPYPAALGARDRRACAFVAVQTLPADPKSRNLAAVREAVKKALKACARAPATKTHEALERQAAHRHERERANETVLARTVATELATGRSTPAGILGRRRPVTERELADFLTGLFGAEPRVTISWRPGS